ncbi:tetratricopeptide (TPR) repeat protein [Virgibacillus halotolerans]|uniref:tetratricopeptide repeat protein n=1 Tax=Virgibacillus halotolerans TaxID=1071053 RepID=UPI00196129A3|nr:tetratricopeptide repeat protein [Virgibacillus halotolerans]MBM7597784.1 tetratricopeptide (TPR) repeat protein [Virgibacillus halotolerans]
MVKQSDNVILFPKWKTALEKESLQALKEKRFEEALEKLNKLLSYDINDHEIVVGKLMCLIELGRFDEAQDICETLLLNKNKDDNYYHYVHIYLTILFQTNQFELLIEQVNHEFEDGSLPESIREQFQQLYDISWKMKENVIDEKSTVYFDDLLRAVKNEEHTKQWRLVENLRNMKSNPTDEVIALLENELVHPVTKTAIINWLREKEISQTVEIHKLNAQVNVKPMELLDIESNTAIKEIGLLINSIEQENPTLFTMIDQLLYRYAYVRYPLMPQEEDVPAIAEALRYIGEQYLNLPVNHADELNDKVQHYIEEINMCESLYSSIIEA